MRNKALGVMFFLLLMLSSVLVFDKAMGSIEFKKYKVINSPKVCGDNLCSEIDEQRSKKGMSTRDIKVCGDRLCSDFPPKMEDAQMPKNHDTPLGQFNFGVPLNLITCKPEFSLIVKANDLQPSCVKPKTALKLIEKRWALNEFKVEQIFVALAEKQINDIVPLEIFAVRENSITITPDEVNGQRYLLIEGFGWHRLHNVEMVISNELGFETSIRSKTSDTGDLHMPWPVPDELPGGLYKIHATDGIHDFEMRFPIAQN